MLYPSWAYPKIFVRNFLVFYRICEAPSICRFDGEMQICFCPNGQPVQDGAECPEPILHNGINLISQQYMLAIIICVGLLLFAVCFIVVYVGKKEFQTSNFKLLFKILKIHFKLQIFSNFFKLNQNLFFSLSPKMQTGFEIEIFRFRTSGSSIASFYGSRRIPQRI